MTVEFCTEYARFPPKLVEIGSIVEKWQPFFEIQDGGRRHSHLRKICIFDVTVVFRVKFATFPPNLVKIGPIVMKWQQFFEIQDGGRRHFDFC